MSKRLFRPFEWPIITKLLVTFVLIALLPLVAAGWYGYNVARQTALESEIRALTTHAGDLALHLDILLAERQSNIRQLAENTVVKAFSADWPEVSPEIQMGAQEDLVNLVQANPYFQAVYLMNPEGEVILSSTDNVGLNFDFRPYFQHALEGEIYVSDISISVDLGQPVIYFSAPMHDQSGEVATVAVLRVLAEEIWTMVEAEKDQLGPGSIAVLFDEYGIRMAHASDRELIFKAVVPLDPQVEAQLLAEHRLGDMEKIESTDFPELAEGLRQAESQPHFVYLRYDPSEDYHAGAARLTTKPWTVVEAVSESSFLAPAKQLGWTFGLLTGTVALMLVLASVLASRWIVEPVRELTAAAQQMAGEQFDRPMAGFRVQRNDEIGVLLQSFESMRVSLQKSYAQLDARNRRLRRLYELAVALTGGVRDVADQVVGIIAELLEVKVAIVEEIHQNRIIVLSMYNHHEIINEGEFQLRDTPCENVLEEKNVCYFTQAVEQFPDDSFLAEHNLITYIGVPILGSQGEVMGVINAMDDRPRDFDEGDIHLLQTLAKRVSVEIERRQAEVELRRRAGELEAIAEVGGLVTAGGDLQTTLDTLAEKIAQAADFEAVGIGLYDAQKEVVSFTAQYTARPMKFLEMRKGSTVRLEGAPVLQHLLREKQHIYFSDPQNDPRIRPDQRELVQEDGIQMIITWPLLFGGELIGTLDLASTRPRSFTPENISLLSTMVDQTAIAVQNAQLFEEIQLYKDAFDSTADAIAITDLDSRILDVNPAFEAITGYSREEALGQKPGLLKSRHSTLEFYRAMWDQILTRGYWSGEIINVRKNGEEWDSLLTISTVKGERGQPVAYIGINHDITERKRREREREALFTVASALRKAPTRAEMLPVILDEVLALLNAGGATLTMRDSHTAEMVIELGRGKWQSATGIRLSDGEGVSGRVMATGQAYVSEDLLTDPHLSRPNMLAGLQAGVCVPLIAQEQTIGVLWVGRATPFTDEEVRLLTAIGDMTANAIQRAGLHEQTYNLAVELEQAYDATLEGWARALELRDEETEGHTRRVTEMTVRLARAMGISEDEIPHVRRGALLHDIGKMGIPDGILLKPGPLTDEEWVIMRQHPVYACNMLSPIEYLRPALDIPCFHHEKWDGSGYPEGLRGEDIPLAARIFAVVDVWDALSSDRPYREAWPLEKVLAYIRDQVGTHFDPAAADAFLRLFSQMRRTGS